MACYISPMAMFYTCRGGIRDGNPPFFVLGFQGFPGFHFSRLTGGHQRWKSIDPFSFLGFRVFCSSRVLGFKLSRVPLFHSGNREFTMDNLIYSILFTLSARPDKSYQSFHAILAEFLIPFRRLLVTVQGV